MKKSVNVFKKLGLFLLLSLAAVLIVRCEKDPVVVIPTQYVIDASTGPGGTFLPKVGQILVEKGKNQSLTPKPDDGNEVETMIVDGDDVTLLLRNNTYTFTEVVSNHTVYATFKKIVKFTVDISVGPGGTSTPNGSIKVVSGGSITLAIIADLGYEPDSITVNGVNHPLEGLTAYNLKDVTSDTEVKIVFKKNLSWDVMQVTWKLDSTYIHEQNGTWSYYKIWGKPGEMQKTIKFLPNGYTAVTINGDNTLSDGFWRIDESKTPPEIHFAGDAAALEGSIYVLEGDLKTRLVLARYNWPFIEDFNKKGDFKYIYTPL